MSLLDHPVSTGTATLLSDRQTDRQVTAAHSSLTLTDILKLRCQMSVSRRQPVKRPTGCRVVTHTGCHSAVKRSFYRRGGSMFLCGDTQPAAGHTELAHRLMLAVPAAEMWQPSSRCHECLQRAQRRWSCAAIYYQAHTHTRAHTSSSTCYCELTG